MARSTHSDTLRLASTGVRGSVRRRQRPTVRASPLTQSGDKLQVTAGYGCITVAPAQRARPPVQPSPPRRPGQSQGGHRRHRCPSRPRHRACRGLQALRRSRHDPPAWIRIRHSLGAPTALLPLALALALGLLLRPTPLVHSSPCAVRSPGRWLAERMVQAAAGRRAGRKAAQAQVQAQWRQVLVPKQRLKGDG